ncbi:MAM and LDL-receptor class A domain-containing protein 1-like [Glandiceps talaboti]
MTLIIFEGIRGSDNTGDIAIDDTELDDGPCPVVIPPTTLPPPTPTYPPDYHNCDFEQSMCTWTQELTDDFDWTRKTGATYTTGTGPSYDHTTSSEDGYYVYIEASSPRVPGDKARLICGTFNYHSPDGICMKFWYHMYGPNVDNLNIYMRIDGQSDTLLWSKYGDHGPHWNYAQIHIQETRDFRILVEGTIGDGWLGDLALDDIFFNTGLCPSSDTCDFENGLCGYSQDINDDFDWTLHQGETGSGGTGPSYDVTYGTTYGHYMYAEMSSPRLPGDKAHLDSPVYDITYDARCLRFWYHMYGADVGELNVYTKQSGALTTKLWGLTDTSMSEWHVNEITVNAARPYQITFEAVTGDGFQGDIALDEIELKNEACYPFGDCDFEHGDTCTWKNGEPARDDIDWVMGSGETATGGTGPIADHTLGTPFGTYLFVDSSLPQVQGDTAWLVSGLFDSMSDRCLRFWYAMDGVDVGTLTVYQWPVTQPSPGTVVFTLSGEQGEDWFEAYVQLPAPGEVYEVIIEAVIGPDVMGDIAIDDITFADGVCPTPPPPCEFECNDGTGTCLPMTQVCDFNSDCLDGADEAVCGYHCTFEQDQCGWNDTSNGQYKWKRWRGATPASNTGPSYDHTTYTAAGWYMYVDTNDGGGVDWGKFSSPLLQHSYSTCEMRFWYHMKGEDIGTLRVIIQEGNDYSFEVWRVDGDHGDNWNIGLAIIGHIHDSFTVSMI